MPPSPPVPIDPVRRKVGVLLVNLGTPDAPDAPALRRYLKQFLWDPRVIEPPPPRWVWWLILNGIILTLRPKRSAALYRNIWMKTGSPLLLNSRCVAAGVQTTLAGRFGDSVVVELGMSYGNPSVASALASLAAQDCGRVVVLSLYPQYSGTTVGSAFDAVADALKRERWVPELRFINTYFEDAAYIRAIAESIRAHWAEHGKPDGQGSRLMLSFHGIPLRYVTAGDPYKAQCLRTADLIWQELGLPEQERYVCFQSQFGKEPWLEPYTEQTLRAWAKQGVQRVDTICPGFSMDCLETLEEMNITNREIFEHEGGKEYHYIESLNGSAAHVGVLSGIAERNCAGWI